MSTFIYIQKMDTGLAPCVHNGVWSLALCKPTIRRRAKVGDIVIAVTPINDGHRLSSWAKVTCKVPTEKFSKKYSKNRDDNIYEMLPNGRFVRRQNVKHTSHNKKEDLQHDLGKNRENAWVLISKDFFAFGNRAKEFPKWTHGLPQLRDEIKKLGRAFRRNFNQDAQKELNQLERILKKSFPQSHNKRFKPRHPGLDIPCESKTEEKKFTCITQKRWRK